MQAAADRRRRRDRAAALRRDRARSRHRRLAREARRGGHRDSVPLARQPSRFRGGAGSPRRARPTSTKASASSTPTKFRTPSRCCATSPIRCRICAPRRCCGRAIVRLSDAAVARLGHACGRRDSQPSSLRPALDAIGDEDRRVLELLRAAVPRWLSWVDRLSPSELLDAVLRETAYAFELRGSRRRQARENLKKLRGMIRRAQNRGYATLARIADHLERLAVGDESNAGDRRDRRRQPDDRPRRQGSRVPDRLRRQHGPRRPAASARRSASTDDAAGEASVAIADYQSEADEDAPAREREETKRLLYVALTRARDRLYLSATVKDGVCRMGRGSLGEVLPASVRARFVRRRTSARSISRPPRSSAAAVDRVRRRLRPAVVIVRLTAELDLRSESLRSIVYTIGHSTRSLDEFVAAAAGARRHAAGGRSHDPEVAAASAFRADALSRIAARCGHQLPPLRRAGGTAQAGAGLAKRRMASRQFSRLRGLHADAGVRGGAGAS